MPNPQYYGTIPQIAQAYQNDPRTKLAQSAIALGTSTTPVAQGKYAVADGIARAAQALAGALVQKSQDKKFAKREQDYTAALQQAAQAASTPQPVNPAVANPATVNPMTAAANALAGPGDSQPAPARGQIIPIDPNTALGAPPVPAQANFAAPAPSIPAAPPMGSSAPLAAARPPLPSLPDALELYRKGIRPIEGGIDPKTGAFRTSPKGAVGPGQVMPGTGPEAARLAGLPWDEKRFRSDANYNDALGAAYYKKQLNDFGDPVVAAAAYNAGPGGVRRAMRKARASGQHWTAHLLPETQQYVQNFTRAVSGVPAASGEGAPGPSAIAQVPPANLQPVPEAPPPPSAQRPDAPALPTEVVSNRIGIAQQMLASGNPDLIGIAQTYLDKGLDDQQQARVLSSQQQFQQGQTGFVADLQNWTGANSDYRQNAYGERRDAIGRNFQSNERVANQQFQANEGGVQRDWQSQEAWRGRNFQAGQSAAERSWNDRNREDQQEWQSRENALNRDNKVDVAQLRQQQRSAYFNSPTGLKMQADVQGKQRANEEAISKYTRFLDLQDKQQTGGAAQNIPLFGGSLNWADNELSEMDKIAKDTTLANLGGGLGAQISDSDRKFIESANIGTANRPQVNRNVARARIGALRRSNDYYTEWQNAQADNSAAQFARNWSLFSKAVPIVQYDAKGNVTVTDQPMTYQQWVQSRTKYNAKGEKVQ